MKKLLLSMIVLASLVSCGKDNKVSSSTSSLNYSNPYLSGNTQAQTYAQTLIAQINSYSSNFGNGVVSSYSNNQTCDTKWIFSYCYTSGSSTVTSSKTWNQIAAENPTYLFSDGYTARNIDVNIASKQGELISLVNAATNVEVQAMSGGNVYKITTSSGYYVIDTRYPIQVNPSAVQSTSALRYFVRTL